MSSDYQTLWTREQDGFTVRAAIHFDEYAAPPWDNEDGHGPVSSWERREKAPGERILAQDHGSRRFYDFAEAVRIAHRDAWGPKQEGDTPGETAARAAEADFKQLKDWIDGRWFYVGVVVTVSKHGHELGTASLWCIESDAGDYFNEVAEELVSEAVKHARDELEKLAA